VHLVGVFIIAVADDLTQYCIIACITSFPGCAFSSHSSFSALYGYGYGKPAEFSVYIFFSQIYLKPRLLILVWEYAALFVTGVKSLITTAAHSALMG